MDMYVFLYLFILIYNLFHPGKFFFHVFHQFELCSATIQIMSLSMNLEIMISLQIVCEETHPTCKGHKNCSHGKHIQFCPPYYENLRWFHEEFLPDSPQAASGNVRKQLHSGKNLPHLLPYHSMWHFQ